MPRRSFLPHIPGIPEDTRKAINAAIRIGSRRASPLAWTAFLITLGLTLFAAVNSRAILTFQQNQISERHCQERLSAAEAKIAEHERELQRLKERTAKN